MSLDPDSLRKIQAVLGQRDADFETLAKLAELDPKRDFVGANLRDVDFGSDNLQAFDFRRANLVGANFAHARGLRLASIERAEFDETTRFPNHLTMIGRLTKFWKTGVPSFVDLFGWDEFGAFFEFSVAGPEGPVTQRMRWIPAGRFLMGSPESEADRSDDEGPQHEVTISKGFWLFDTACTQGLWQAVMGHNPSRFKGSSKLPVERVSWNDACEFVARIEREVPGLRLSLPSEAQWEYACRAGTTTPFSFGETINPEQVNYDGRFPYGGAPKGLFRETTVPVGSLPPNAWGLHEMHGNVLEWVEDAWQGDYTGAPVDGSAWKDESAARRVLRGGSWGSGARLVRSARRLADDPGDRGAGVGFRCARVQEGAEPAETRRIRQAERRIAASPSGEAAAVIVQAGAEGAAIFPRGGPFVIRGDCERLYFEGLPRPKWASAIGRDRFGLWTEFEVAGEPNPVTQRMRWIPPGRFLMGSPAGEVDRFDDEGPQHQVTISKGFWLFDTACRQSLWQAVMGENPSKFRGEAWPVETVSWEDCQRFLERVNALVSDLNLGLPSEAQWEYACRAGKTTPFSFGETINPEQVNYDGDYPYAGAPKGLNRQTTVPVGSLPPNAWGLHEMHGNVWEWVGDSWHENYAGAPIDGSAWKDESAAGRVLRGGSWNRDARNVRSACRGARDPGNRDDGVGFRCARVQE